METAANLVAEKPETAGNVEEPIPTGFGRGYRGVMSTQQIFGLVLTDISRNVPGLSERLVTASPDVASSTNLGGWINRAGVWSRHEREQVPEEEIPRALQWVESRSGQHIELGISENNLFMLLGQLGISHEAAGETLFPIGTLYDPFVRRGLDAFVYSVYNGGKFILVGTPSGVTLGPEGGAAPVGDHAVDRGCVPGAGVLRAVLRSGAGVGDAGGVGEDTAAGGVDLPAAYEQAGGPGAVQPCACSLEDPELLRRQVLGGAYRLLDRSGEDGYGSEYNVVNVFASGAMVPEAVAASDRLLEEGVFANVINVTGPGPLYRRFQESVRARAPAEPRSRSRSCRRSSPLGERSAPIVTVVDGAPHSLAWIGAAMRATTLPLGVMDFGQSGSPEELYGEYEIDADSIMAACFGALNM